MSWIERQLERLRSLNPLVVDSIVAAVFTVISVVSSYNQSIRDDAGLVRDGFREPGPLLVLTTLVVCVPIAFRRRAPLTALVISSLGILVHIVIGWPEGTLPIAVLFLTFSAGVWCPLRRSLIALAFVCGTIIILGLTDSPGLDAVGVVAILGQFAAGWAIGVAVRNRRAATDARVREAEERAEAEQHAAARVLAEERLRIAQELHDVVAHSMSVIAVQAGVGAHVLDDHPDQARVALEAISETSRATLTELRRLLGVLRDSEGVRSSAPAPGLVDLPHLVDEVRAAGVPAELHIEGLADCIHPGIELSAYRVVQEALTNVMKHAGQPTRVAVTVSYLPDAVAVEVVDDGRGLAARSSNGAASDTAADGSGHGLVGMRERVDLWGGELAVGPVQGGGYRVKALLPYGDAE